MAVKMIEARYYIEAVHLWRADHIEDWPCDEEGKPYDLEHADDYFIKWGLLHVKWPFAATGDYAEYEPTYESSGDHGDDYKWPDAEYHDGVRVDDVAMDDIAAQENAAICRAMKNN
jgi:hypothetical protein